MAKNLRSMFWLGSFLLRAVMENLFQASLLASSRLLESIVISLLVESLLMSVFIFMRCSPCESDSVPKFLLFARTSVILESTLWPHLSQWHLHWPRFQIRSHFGVWWLGLHMNLGGYKSTHNTHFALSCHCQALTSTSSWLHPSDWLCSGLSFGSGTANWEGHWLYLGKVAPGQPRTQSCGAEVWGRVDP